MPIVVSLQKWATEIGWIRKARRNLSQKNQMVFIVFRFRL